MHATITNVSVGTLDLKVIIPIPDPTKHVKKREGGMFRYAAGTQGTNGMGYTFGLIDLKFEKIRNN